MELDSKELKDFFSAENSLKRDKDHLSKFKVFSIVIGNNVIGKTVGGPMSFDIDLLQAKNIKLIATDDDPLNFDDGYKTVDSWICKCEKNFIHSGALHVCPLCEGSILEPVQKLKRFEDLLGDWGEILIGG